ncbi:class I SAM-dependent methyltransferase [Sphaerotilus sp.]|uniref:class I SAM-dependent methyltransferase n=1 Tax=Sphaerotilus sp. TaxID=2093942 RepID=UPI00286DF148|nr:class I SAM-dependent methyltransferase [Sphaerotilus sp.]
MAMAEPDRVTERYARRGTDPALADRYSLLQPDVWQTVQERQRAMLRLLARRGWHDLRERRLLEVGCGAGGNLLEFLRMGWQPEHLAGIELLPERHAHARAVLPERVALHLGDACTAPIAEASCDLVFQATVFSSLLDDAFQQRLAAAMWRWVKPGGAVLWYDFTVDNPRNRDVRGVPLRRVRALFPEGRIEARRVTLAPPLARAACRVWPGWYPVLNAVPVLRTHVLAWVGKDTR